jgi:predicted nuclease of predicted toxin-antitoxin system
VCLLADESCDYSVVKALRELVIEDSRAAPDREVFARSRREHRVLLTEDKDFGTAGRGLPELGIRKTMSVF